MRIQDRYELAAELRERYWAAGRAERGRLLDALCLATGYNRKYAIAVLHGRERRVRLVRRPRARRYGLEFRNALKVVWEAAGYICSERLRPFIGELVPLLRRHGQLKVDAETEALLNAASLATIERNLAQLRRGLVARRMSQTKPGSLLRKQIPVIVGRWKELDQAGYLEVDLVSHSGDLAAGEWIWTLTATDLSTGWTERVPVMGHGQATVLAALSRVREQLPFPLLGLHPDNGSEFLNWHLVNLLPGRPSRGAAARLALALPARAQERQRPRRAEELDPGPPHHRLPAPRQPSPAGLARLPLHRTAPSIQQLLPARHEAGRQRAGRSAHPQALRHPDDSFASRPRLRRRRPQQDRQPGRSLHDSEPAHPEKEDRPPPGRHAHSPGGEPCHGLISPAPPPAPRSDSFVRERISYGQILI